VFLALIHRPVISGAVLASVLVLTTSCVNDDRSTQTMSTEQSLPSTASEVLTVVVAGASVVDFPAAEIGGTLRREESVEAVCLFLDSDGESRFVIWPNGTAWSEADQGVFLPPEGRLLQIGDLIAVGGGETKRASVPQLLSPEMATLLSRCAPDSELTIVAPDS
jgi:hypothetical protein